MRPAVFVNTVAVRAVERSVSLDPPFSRVSSREHEEDNSMSGPRAWNHRLLECVSSYFIFLLYSQA